LLLPNLSTPIAKWCPATRLTLPPAAKAGTIILRDIDALTAADQRYLLAWLDLTAGRTQVVSTIASPLLSRVQTGGFLERLYYRLNTVCVDATS
jgi:DNA-binding NtrC family response regulator